MQCETEKAIEKGQMSGPVCVTAVCVCIMFAGAEPKSSHSVYSAIVEGWTAAAT